MGIFPHLEVQKEKYSLSQDSLPLFVESFKSQSATIGNQEASYDFQLVNEKPNVFFVKTSNTSVPCQTALGWTVD